MTAYRVGYGSVIHDQTVMSIEITDCPSCGVLFGAPVRLLDNRRRTGENFYCPSGHPMTYTETVEQKLRRQLAQRDEMVESAEIRARAWRDQAQAAERSNRALKGVVTKTKRRIGNGVCPCCNRHFANVERHMSNKHPDYAEPEQ